MSDSTQEVATRSDPGFIASITAGDIDTAVQIFATRGVCILPDALTPAELDAIKAKLYSDVERDEAAGVLYRGSPGSDFDDRSIRIANLPNKGRLFLDLLENPIVERFLWKFLGRGALVSSFTANVVMPGAAGMVWHTDQGYVPPPWPPYPLAINFLWPLVDTTRDNGATWIVPDSHQFASSPAARGSYAATAIELPAGSIFVLDGRVWHRTGQNSTQQCERPMLIAYCCRGFIRTQVNWSQALLPQVMANLTRRQRDLFGLEYNPTNDITVWDDRASV